MTRRLIRNADLGLAIEEIAGTMLVNEGEQTHRPTITAMNRAAIIKTLDGGTIDDAVEAIHLMGSLLVYCLEFVNGNDNEAARGTYAHAMYNHVLSRNGHT